MATAPAPSTPAAPKWWLTLLAAGFPSLVAIQTALNLYVGNNQNLMEGVAGLVSVVVAALALWGVLFCALRWGKVFGKIAWALPSAYAAFFLIRDVAFPLPLIPLVEGTSIVPQSSGLYRITEGATLIAALGLLLGLRLRLTAPVAAVFSAVFAASALTSAAANASALAGSDTAVSQTSADMSPAAAADKPDVYQILFDTYQTVEHQFTRKNNGVGPYADFIHYKNNISQYNWTRFSIPSLWTSTVYDPVQEVGDWQDDAHTTRGILKTLKDNGYHIRIQGAFSHWKEIALADSVRVKKDLIKECQERAGGDGFAVRSDEFLHLMKLRGLPTFLGKKAYAASSGQAGAPPANASAFYSMAQYRELVAGIKDRPAGGTYNFAHLILPHPPFVLTEDGDFNPARSSRYAQAQLVDKLVGELTAELKRLGRYEQSMIIVHADTGFFIDPDFATQGLDEKKEMKQAAGWDRSVLSLPGPQWPLSIVRSWTQAALLIKPPVHHGYEEVDAPTQLTDISPTILGAVGIADTKGEYKGGVDLLKSLPGPDRARKAYIFGVLRSRGESLTFPIQEFKVSHDGRYEKGGVITAHGKTDLDE